jgi:hypothetical protein
LRSDEREAAAAYRAEAAVRDALVGNAALAKQEAHNALAFTRGTDVEGIAAIALGLAGDPVQAESLANDLV